MRILGTILLLLFSMSFVQANNFYQSNNPFPEQTCQPESQNIYATEPRVEVKEEITKKKMGFWGKKNKATKGVKDNTSNINEGIQASPDGRFYVFPAK